MIKDLTIKVTLDTTQAKAEADKLYQFLTNISGAGSTGGTAPTQATAATKEITIAKQQLSQAMLDEQRNLQQSNEGWERETKRLQAAKIATQELDIAFKQLVQSNALMTRTGGFQWLTGAEGGKSASESAKVFAQSFREMDIALQQAAKSNAILTKAGAFQWITGLQSGKNAAESARVFSAQLALMDKAQVEALKLNAAYMGLSKSLMVSPQAIASWNLQEKEMTDVLRKYQALAVMSKQVGGGQLTQLMAMMRGGATFKGSLGESMNIDVQGLQGLMKYFDDLKIKAPDAYNAVRKSLVPLGVQLEKTHSKTQTFIDSVKSYAGFQIKFYAGMAAIFGVVAAVRHAARESLVFAQALKEIQAVTGATDAEIKQLSNSAKKLSVETPLAATEIAKLGLQLMRAGLDIETTIAAMEASAKIATISGEDLKTVADTIASVFMIWKLGAEDATRAGTALAAALNYSKLNIQDFGTALNYVGGMASTMKFSLEEVSAVLASMSNLGVRASTMATGWRQFIASMIAPSGKLAEHLRYVGANFDKLNAIKIDGPNKMATILAEMNRISPITGKEILSVADIVKLLERRTSAFALALKTVGVPYLLKMQESMKDTRAYTEGLARVMEGPIAAFKVFGNQIQLSILNLSEILLPVIRAVINGFTALASVLSHSIHFFTDGAGKILIYAATLTSAIVVLRNFKIAALQALAISAWNQIIIIMNSFSAVLISVASNVALLGKELKNLWYIIARNPLGLFLMIITAIVGTAFIDWLISGQTEMEKMNAKAKELTKSQIEMLKKGEDLRKQYPEFFQEIAEGATDATEKMDKFKQSLDKALNAIPKYSEPIIPTDIENWINNVLIPANEEVAKLQSKLNALREEIAKINAEATKITWWDRMKQALRETGAFLEKVGLGFGQLWNIVKTVLTLIAEKAMQLFNFLANIPFLKPWLESARSSLRSIYNEIKEFPKNIKLGWDIIDQKIIDEKTKNAKAKLQDLAETNKHVIEQLKKAQESFSEAIKQGKFDDILERVAGSMQKISTAELREQGLKNLASTLATIAQQDPTRFKNVLGITAQAYLEWVDKIGKGDEKLARRAARKEAEIIGVDYEHFKDRYALLKKLNAAEVEDLKATLALEAEAERHAIALQNASLEDRKWILETFYREELMDAKAYYDQKLQLMSESYGNERQLIISETSRQLEMQMKEYKNAEDEWFKLVEQLDEKFNQLSKITPVSLQDLLIDEDFAILFARASENLQPSIKKLTDEIRNLENQEQDLITTQQKLNQNMLLESTQAYNKLIEMTAKEASEVMKLNHERAIALATQSYRHEEFRIKNQQEYNVVMLQAKEIVGNWNEVENIKLQILENDNKLSEIAIQKQIAQTQATIDYLKVIEAVLKAWKQETDYIDKEIEALQALLPTLEDLLKIRKTLSAQSEADVRQRKDNPIIWAIQQVNEEWNNTNKILIEEAEKTYRAMAASFSDIFYDAVTGKLKKLEDYFKSIFESILRYFTDTVGRMAAQKIMVNLGFSGGGAAGVGGLDLSNLNFLGGGASYLAPAGSQGMGFGANVPQGAGLGYEIAAGGSPSPLPYFGAAAGAYGVYNAYQTGNPFMGAASGAVMGASIGSIIPGIGTVIGAIVGGITGLIAGLFGGPDHIPNMQVGYKLGGEGHSEEYKSIFGDTEWAVRMYDKVGIENAKVINKTFETLKDELGKFLEATGGDLSKLSEAWKSSSVDIDKDLKKTVQKWIEEYANFITGLDFSKFKKEGEEISDTVARIIATYTEGLPRLKKAVDDYIYAIEKGDDAIANARKQLGEYDDNIKKLDKSMNEATDPTDALQYGAQLIQATYERYALERDLIMGIVDAIRQMEGELASFTISMQQKIDGLTGAFAGVGLIWERFTSIADQLANSSLTAAEKLALLQEGIGWLDQWVQANIEMIQAQYEAQKKAIQQQIDNINKQIDALNDQKDVISDQIDALQKQVDLVKEWSSVLDSVKKQLLDMRTSLTSPRDVFERMDVLKSEIERVKGLYAGATGEEKAGYASELQSLIADYLSIAQEAYQRPSDAYQQIYDDMIGLLEMIQTDAQAFSVSEEDLLQQIAVLEEQSKVIDEQIASYQLQIKNLNEKMAQLDEQMALDIQAFKESAVQYYEWAQTVGVELYQAEIESLREKLREIIGDEDVETYLHNLQEATVLELVSIRDILQKLLDAFLNIPQSATGRLAMSPMLTWVGEKEPELIIPASAMAGFNGGSRGDTYITISIPVNVGEISDMAMADRVANRVADKVISKLPKSPKGRLIIQQVAGGR